MPPDVLRSFAEQIRIVAEVSKSLIAASTEQIPHGTRLVVVIYVESSCCLDAAGGWFRSAENAPATLLSELGLKPLQRDAVFLHCATEVVQADYLGVWGGRDATPRQHPLLDLWPLHPFLRLRDFFGKLRAACATADEVV